MKRILLVPVAVVLASLLPGCARGSSEDRARIAALEAEVKALRGEVPDQAAVMSIQAYHFTNLWFALDQENWPLAGFYLGETQKNLKWAVRIKPVRKDRNGADVNVAAIAESLQNGQLSELRAAIGAKDKARAVKAYKDTLAGCHACHEAASKPFLMPQIPAEPQVRIIAFSPGARVPE